MISASDETRGCSDDKWYREDDCVCFGASKYNQSRSGKQMLIIGIVLLILEIIVFCSSFVLFSIDSLALSHSYKKSGADLDLSTALFCAFDGKFPLYYRCGRVL